MHNFEKRTFLASKKPHLSILSPQEKDSLRTIRKGREQFKRKISDIICNNLYPIFVISETQLIKL